MNREFIEARVAYRPTGWQSIRQREVEQFATTHVVGKAVVAGPKREQSLL
jgi:hypothetical protein